jgi:hypothetical protein
MKHTALEQKDYDEQIYNLAKEFLLSISVRKIQPITHELLDIYLVSEPRPADIADIYERILSSAQSGNMKAGVIGRSIGGIANLRETLCDFQPKAILDKYGDNSEQVFRDIQHNVKPRGKVNPNSRGLWPIYCKTILAGAKFMVQFESANDFYAWVKLFDSEDRMRRALPLLLQAEIYGFGFALACDFLKDLGFLKFAKPDVHLRKIFTRLELCPSSANDYQLLEAIVRVADNAGVTPYNADKIFWLIGSGSFYKHKIKVGRRADEFIEYARSSLK